MDTLVIGRPALNTYLSLVEFPKEGDIFTLPNAYENLGNVAATSACLLNKWGIKTHITGVVGNDGQAEKIREIFNKYKVDIKYIETDYTHRSASNYIILDNKKGTNAKIICHDNAVQLQRFKYDFIPNWAILDSTELAGCFATINSNIDNCKKIFYARIGDKDSITISKRCNYVICTERYMEDVTHEKCDGSAEACVAIFQKLVDYGGHNNYIVIMNNNKILYASKNQVKMLPAVKLSLFDTSSFNSVFVGAFAFGMILESELDDVIKFANMAASLSCTKLGEEASIPELNDVLSNSGLQDRIKVKEQAPNSVTPAPAEQVANPVVNQVVPEQTSVTPVTPIVQEEKPAIDPFNAAVEPTPINNNQTIMNQVPNNPEIIQNPINNVVSNPVPNYQPVNHPVQEETNIFDVQTN